MLTYEHYDLSAILAFALGYLGHLFWWHADQH